MMGHTPMIAAVGILELLVLLGIVLIVLFAWMRRRPAPPADPTCGKCRYIVRGISSLTCPECGSDLREVGIIPPGTRRPMGLFARRVIWSVILLVPAVILSNLFLDTLAPMVHTRVVSCRISSVNGRFKATIDAQMKGGAVCWGGRRYNPNIPLQTLELGYSSTPGHPPLLSMDLSTEVWTLTDANNKTTTRTGLDDQAIIALLAANGFDASDSRIWVLAAKILADLRTMTGWMTSGVLVIPAGAPSPATQISFTGSPAQPHPAAYTVLVAFWLLIWLLGLWLITRSFRSKMLAHADEQSAMAR